MEFLLPPKCGKRRDEESGVGGSGGGPDPRGALTGEDAATVVAAFCKLGGTRGGASKKLPGWSDPPPDKLEELLETLRRPSPPAWKEEAPVKVLCGT